MSKKVTSTVDRKKWHKDWSVGVKVSVERRDEVVLDDPSAAMLQAVGQMHSISAAGRALGISYRHAWLLIQKANERAGQQLVTTATGGEKGGGTDLTEYGRAALEVFERVRSEVRSAATRALPKVLESMVPQRPVVHLAAAISMQEAVSQILSEYALVRPTVSVRTHYGASNELASLIEQGGACDLFISASRDPIDQLAKKDLVRRGSRKVLAKNGLAIVATTDISTKIGELSHIGKVQNAEIIVADPDCPLGDFTKQILKAAKVYDSIQGQLVTVDNSRAVVAALRATKSRVGIIFSSDISNAIGLKVLLQISAKDIKASYEAAIIANSQQPDEAKELLGYLKSDAAEACFRRCGFVV